MPFLYSNWYSAGWSECVKDAPARRVICGEPVVLYRDNSGCLTVLQDICPHRAASLSMGRRAKLQNFTVGDGASRRARTMPQQLIADEQSANSTQPVTLAAEQRSTPALDNQIHLTQ